MVFRVQFPSTRSGGCASRAKCLKAEFVKLYFPGVPFLEVSEAVFVKE